MSLLDLASSQSLWRGLDYYENGNVISAEKINEAEYKGIVSKFS